MLYLLKLDTAIFQLAANTALTNAVDKTGKAV